MESFDTDHCKAMTGDVITDVPSPAKIGSDYDAWPSRTTAEEQWPPSAAEYALNSHCLPEAWAVASGCGSKAPTSPVASLLPQETEYSEGGSRLFIENEDEVDELRAMISQVELFGQALRNLSDDVRVSDERQMLFDRRLAEVSGHVQGLAEEHHQHSVRFAELEGQPDGCHYTLPERVGALECGQKTLASGLKRAFQTAMMVQHQQEDWAPFLEEIRDKTTPGMGDFLACVAPPPVSLSTVGGAESRLAELDEWVSRLAQQERSLAALSDTVEVMAAKDRGRVLAGEHEDLSSTAHADQGALVEVQRRVDALHDEVGEKVLGPLYQLSRQVPEIHARIDRVHSQCQGSVAKVEEHEVRLDLFRASTEANEQRIASLAERVECLPTHEVGAGSAARRLQETVGAVLKIGSHASNAANVRPGEGLASPRMAAHVMALNSMAAGSKSMSSLHSRVSGHES